MGRGDAPRIFLALIFIGGLNKAQPQSGRARREGGKTIKVAIIA